MGLRDLFSKGATSRTELVTERLSDQFEHLQLVSLADMPLRERVEVCGEIRRMTVKPRAGIPAVEVEINDGTGELTVIFSGRQRIPGIGHNRCLTVCGVARVNNPKNYWMFNQMWGVDVSVSTPHLITSLVQEATSVGNFVRLMQLKGGKAELVEVTLAETSPAANKALSELVLPRSATIVALVRAERVLRRIMTDRPAVEWTDPSAELSIVERLAADAWVGERTTRINSGPGRVVGVRRYGKA
ncbi:MAG: hypothetical protein ACKOJH_11800, partial [Actinomycetota bacterium]